MITLINMTAKLAKNIEVERKYEVAADSVLPLSFESAGFKIVSDETFELAATYFDTEDFLLAAARIALRKRKGGHDEGWHIKMKKQDTATEYSWPIASDIPLETRAKLQTLLQTKNLSFIPIATINSTRRQLTLSKNGQSADCFLMDDNVQTTDFITGIKKSWREWEFELANHQEAKIFVMVEPILFAAGATRSTSFSKIRRARGN